MASMICRSLARGIYDWHETMSSLATTALKAVCVRQIACHFLCRSVMTSKVCTGVSSRPAYPKSTLLLSTELLRSGWPKDSSPKQGKLWPGKWSGCKPWRDIRQMQDHSSFQRN